MSNLALTRKSRIMSRRMEHHRLAESIFDNQSADISDIRFSTLARRLNDSKGLNGRRRYQALDSKDFSNKTFVINILAGS
jgi:hypothetical protein